MSMRTFVLCSLIFITAALTSIGFNTHADSLFVDDAKVFDKLSGRNHRVFIKDGEILRNVEYYEDQITRRHATTFGIDGSKTEFWYWPSGNLKEAVTYFPENDSNKNKRVMRRATLLEDGITYATNLEYNQDGTLSTSTVLEQSQDRSTRRRYFENGSIKQEEVFAIRQTTPLATWYRLSSRTFHANTNLAESIEVVGIFGYQTQRFAEDGRTLFVSELSEYGTEGQFRGEEYNTTQGAIAYGVGFKMDLSYRWSINAELSARKVFTDYLDDVSGNYADLRDIRAQRGETGAALADRSIEPQIGQAGRQRGNGKNNDSYIILGIGVQYYFGYIRCPAFTR